MIDLDRIDEESLHIARRVREELARRRMSRQALADKARVSLSTIEKALAGTRPFTLATTVRIEDVLQVGLRDHAPAGCSAVRSEAPLPATAPAHMGSYSRAAVRWIEKDYCAVRPSFGADRAALHVYRITIAWDPEAAHLVFAERDRLDAQFEQSGFVSMPHLSGHIYLVTEVEGQYRMMVLGRPTLGGTMNGILSTLQVGAGTQLVPVACPVALIPAARIELPRYGLIGSDDPDYAGYRAVIDRVTAEDFARIR